MRRTKDYCRSDTSCNGTQQSNASSDIEKASKMAALPHVITHTHASLRISQFKMFTVLTSLLSGMRLQLDDGQALTPRYPVIRGRVISYRVNSISNEPTSSLFRAENTVGYREDGGSKFLPNDASTLTALPTTNIASNKTTCELQEVAVYTTDCTHHAVQPVTNITRSTVRISPVIQQHNE
jgi:hypothetical protein